MPNGVRVVFAISLLILGSFAMAASYTQQLCRLPSISCIKILKNQSWESLWRNPYHRDLIKRLNRVNTPLVPGMIVAVPKKFPSDNNEAAPFDKQIPSPGVNMIVVSLRDLAWGAYTPEGKLIKWGPVSGGQNYCKDIDRTCFSKMGVYTIYEKRGPDCISTKFPVDEGGGAPMPYCMFYFGGYALHGSPLVPGYHASHGCIRLYNEDARWLNREFVQPGKTKIIVLPYN